MNKRGAEILLWNIIVIVLFITAFASIGVWISNNIRGDAIKPDLIAKQTALLIDLADPGTTIFVNADIVIEGQKITAVYNDLKSEYSFFSNSTVTARKVEGGTEIKIT
mgnify:CR=1 FL=1